MKSLFRYILVEIVCLALLSCIVGCASKEKAKPEYGLNEERFLTPVFHMHTVKYPGETLGIISLWYTKNVNNWKPILVQNPELDEKRIKIGDQIRIPEYLIARKGALTEDFVRKIVGRLASEKEAVDNTKTTVIPEPTIEAESVEVKVETPEKTEDLAVPSKPTPSIPEKIEVVETINNENVEPSTQKQKVDPIVELGWDDLPVKDTPKDKSMNKDEIDRAQLLEELLE